MAKTGVPARAVTAPPRSSTLDFALDRGGPVPLYYQLAQQLEAAIEQGVLAPGNLLGSRVDLSVRLGLSPADRPSGHPVPGRQGAAGPAARGRHAGRAQPGQTSPGTEQSLRRPGGGRAGTHHAGGAQRGRARPRPTWRRPLGVAEGGEVTVLERLRLHPTASRWRCCATTCRRRCWTSTTPGWSRPACTG